MVDSIYLEYEDSLIGRKKDLSAYHFYGTTPGGANEKRALELIRYALEGVVGWDKEECKKKFDLYMVNVLKLNKVITYIKWPVEVDFGNCRYILAKLYPEDIHLNTTKLIEDTYQKVLDGEQTFPREYFMGIKGFYRFCTCLRYLLNQFVVFHHVEETYSFLHSREGQHFLDRYRLLVPSNILGINIDDAIHVITQGQPNAEIVFLYYQYLSQCELFEYPIAAPDLQDGVCRLTYDEYDEWLDEFDNIKLSLVWPDEKDLVLFRKQPAKYLKFACLLYECGSKPETQKDHYKKKNLSLFINKYLELADEEPAIVDIN